MRRKSGTLSIDFRSGGRPEDYEGEYQCFARNDFGTAISNKIILQVSSEYDNYRVCNTEDYSFRESMTKFSVAF